MQVTTPRPCEFLHKIIYCMEVSVDNSMEEPHVPHQECNVNNLLWKTQTHP